ncbi:MAG TPA: type II toxin-antitoxin system prevent-host-death family antitoxin [Methylomirabilota bacterium]|nr:type II toxin-antitoxin system prevent-host-death family antitoxin [Methylomirabilota bacterium]
MTTVGVYEAKTQLPRLIDEVAKGARVTITKHGVPVAMLVPAAGVRRVALDDVINALQAFRKGRRLGGRSLRALIAQGRR